MENALIGTAEVVHRIKRILIEDLQLGLAPDAIPDDYSLMEGGLALDSILVAELIAQIQNRFGLQFDDRVLEAELFENLSHLAAFVARECLAVQSSGKGSQPEGTPC